MSFTLLKAIPRSSLFKRGMLKVALVYAEVAGNQTLDMYRCPKWDGCSAPLCPLGMLGSHLPGERVCFYLLESTKAGAEARFAAYPTQGGVTGEQLYQAMVEATPAIQSRYASIGRAMLRASKTPSRIRKVGKGVKS